MTPERAKDIEELAKWIAGVFTWIFIAGMVTGCALTHLGLWIQAITH